METCALVLKAPIGSCQNKTELQLQLFLPAFLSGHFLSGQRNSSELKGFKEKEPNSLQTSAEQHNSNIVNVIKSKTFVASLGQGNLLK